MIDAITHKAASLLRTNQGAAFSAGYSSAEPSREGASKAEGPSPTPLSPRLRYDAVSGVVITEFLDHAGAISAQTPNNAVLAYLRAGLGSDGRAKEENGKTPKDQA